MQSTRTTLMDNYDYVMFGRIFKYKDAPSQGQVRSLSGPSPSKGSRCRWHAHYKRWPWCVLCVLTRHRPVKIIFGLRMHV